MDSSPVDPSPSAPPRVSALDPLRHPVFRAIWIASLASNLGGLVQSVGASWTMTSMATSADMVALVQASTTLPIMLLSLPAGAIADNMDRRLVMLVAQIFMLTVSVSLAIAAWAGVLNPWLLLLFTFLIGCGQSFQGPAWQASVGEMVPRRDLASAVTLNGMGFNLARSVGPAIGGLIVATAGAAAAFALNAVSYLGIITVLLRWRPERPPRLLPPERLDIAMSAGIRYVAMSPAICAVLLRGAVFGLGAAALPALMPLVVRDLVAGGPSIFGLILGAFGIGGVSGALLSRRVRGAMSVETMIRWACLMFGAGAVVTGLGRWLPLTLVAVFFCGGSWVTALSSLNVSVQMSAPRWVLARALAIYQMATFGGMALGSWLWGLLAESRGVSIALYGGAAVLVACILVGLRVRLPEAEDLDLDPLSRWKEPRTAVPVEPVSGPVVVTLQYRIRPQDVLEFLTVMAERRRIRRRDGARGWTLLRDLGDEEIWIERYSTPTWVEYVRHNQRTTQADAAIADRVRALHQGPDPIRVQRLLERQTGSLPATRRGATGPIADPTPPS